MMHALIDCGEKFFLGDLDGQNEVLSVEFTKYTMKVGMFGTPLAERGYKKIRETQNPVSWWYNFGGHAPRLQIMAMKILSLTTSSSGCERNWSTFEGVHTTKRNRLGTTRLNDLVYVQFNAKIINKNKRMKDPLLASDVSQAP